MNIFETAVNFLHTNSVIIGTVVAILFGVAKAASNENAGRVVGAIQKVVDTAASLVSGLGRLLGAISEILANMIKSDGMFGKK